MITQIKGKVLEKEPTRVVIDCNGIGYELHISLYTYSKIKDTENLTLYTHLQITQDSHNLFGFFNLLERTIFRLLISVSGIGSSIARIMLSSMDPDQIRNLIITENVKAIESIKGIGHKTAQRVIIELKDKISKLYSTEDILPVLNNSIKEETLSALEVLGYRRKSVEKIADKIIQSNPNHSTEELIKEILNKL